MDEFHHVTVLLNELVDMLNIKSGDTVIDCTFGKGGHTELMLERVGKSGKVYAMDRDTIALSFGRKRFSQQLAAGQLILVHKPFSSLSAMVAEHRIQGSITAIAADIGVSSPQLDDNSRGFSFMNDGPLDMRMDQSSGPSAADLVNNSSFEELKSILKEFGEDPKAHFIAQAICHERTKQRIETTSQLATIVDNAVHYDSKSKKHPATKTFQALRIAVNREIDELNTLLTSGFDLLNKGGRIGIISFHSLEDRPVKEFMVERSEKGMSQKLPRGLPVSDDYIQSMVQGKIVKPFPAVPSDAEVAANPRSRSAKLRVLEKLR